MLGVDWTISSGLDCIVKMQRREWSFGSETMEPNTGSLRCNRTQPLEHSTCTDKENQPTDKDMGTSVFVNHAAIAWQESRRKWMGDSSRRPKRKAKDPILSWSMAYEDLLLTNEPFPESIPLPEMVDFLVDIWFDEGLFD
ncbi:geraniol 8-hydroxylase-like [Fagus crenata]